MTNLSELSNSYDISERLASLEISRSFIWSVIYQAHRNGDKPTMHEFNAKLDAVNKEIDDLTKDL